MFGTIFGTCAVTTLYWLDHFGASVGAARTDRVLSTITNAKGKEAERIKKKTKKM